MTVDDTPVPLVQNMQPSSLRQMTERRLYLHKVAQFFDAGMRTDLVLSPSQRSHRQHRTLLCPESLHLLQPYGVHQ